MTPAHPQLIFLYIYTHPHTLVVRRPQKCYRTCCTHHRRDRYDVQVVAMSDVPPGRRYVVRKSLQSNHPKFFFFRNSCTAQVGTFSTCHVRRTVESSLRRTQFLTVQPPQKTFFTEIHAPLTSVHSLLAMYDVRSDLPYVVRKSLQSNPKVYNFVQQIHVQLQSVHSLLAMSDVRRSTKIVMVQRPTTESHYQVRRTTYEVRR
jgi:hypothetical protein